MRTLVEYLDHRLGKHEGRGPEFRWHCPVCIDRMGSEGQRPHLFVNTARRMGHCFRCDYAFRSLDAFFRYLNDGRITLEEARIIRRANPRPKGDTPTSAVRTALGLDQKKDADLRPVDLPRERLDLLETKSILARRGLAYLESRGLGEREVRRYEISYCIQGDYKGYLVFPVRMGGDPVYFTTRFAGQVRGRQLKSKNPPKADGYFTKGSVLLNFDACLGKKRIGLVEGPFDVMGFGFVGHAVGLLGKSISDEQVALIDLLVDQGLQELVIALDDEAGVNANKVYTRLLGRVPKLSVLFLDHGDPFDRREDLRDLLRTRRQPSALDRINLKPGSSRGRRKRTLRHTEGPNLLD